MKVYSYMAAGKAIVATSIRSHLQVLDPATAALVEPQAESLAAALQRLVEDESLRRRLGEAARDKVEREYSLEKYRQTLTDAYLFVAQR